MKISKNESIVAQPGQAEHVQECDIAYFTDRRAGEPCDVCRSAGSQPLLTVAWAEGFAECGGVIELTQRGNKFRFIINRKAAEAHHLKINSQLLALASSVINP